LLVSFPPLNYMLKFSGSSCLIGDPKGEALLRLLVKEEEQGARSSLVQQPLGA